MKTQTRNTAVISISLPKRTVRALEETRRQNGQSKSAFIAALIEKEREDRRWQRIYKKGEEIAKKLGITSEEDVDRILHEAS